MLALCKKLTRLADMFMEATRLALDAGKVVVWKRAMHSHNITMVTPRPREGLQQCQLYHFALSELHAFQGVSIQYVHIHNGYTNIDMTEW